MAAHVQADAERPHVRPRIARVGDAAPPARPCPKQSNILLSIYTDRGHLAVATRAERVAIGRRRILNILRTYTVAGLRTLEQKISDAGPPDQRIDPHLLTKAKQALGDQITSTGVWLHLSNAPAHEVARRIAELEPVLSENHIRTYLWCSPARIGMATMAPDRWTARCKGASFCNAKCVRA